MNAIDRRSRAIRCAKCGAGPGAPCRNAIREAATVSHAARTRPVKRSLALAYAALGSGSAASDPPSAEWRRDPP